METYERWGKRAGGRGEEGGGSGTPGTDRLVGGSEGRGGGSGTPGTDRRMGGGVWSGGPVLPARLSNGENWGGWGYPALAPLKSPRSFQSFYRIDDGHLLCTKSQLNKFNK